MNWRWILCMVFSASIYLGSAQQTTDTLSISFRDLPLEIVLDSITFKSGYYFSYNTDALPKGSLYTLSRTGIHVDSLLNILLVGTFLEFFRYEDQIIIRAGERQQKKEYVPPSNSVEITGWVREYRSKNPIEGVNVFINGTTLGTVTDQYGNYELSNVPFGSYILVFSHVGYELASYSLKVENNRSYAINGLLDFKVRTLDQVEIISDPIISAEEWPKYYKSFLREFLGTSANALRCEILNPEALDFSFNEVSGVLKAEALEPLIIQNEALGYRISYELESFEKGDGRTSFYGKALFTHLDPPNARLRKKWRKSRLKTYHGSIFHFFRSLVSGDLETEGYKLYGFNEISELNDKKYVQITADDLFSVGDNRYEWKLDFDGFVMVSYEKELESTQYLNYLMESDMAMNGVSTINGMYNQKPESQKSIIELKRTYVTLDHNGQIKEPLGLTTIGYWAWERVADLMPADYDPRSDNL